MSMEQSVQNLADAINNLAKAWGAAPANTPSTSKPAARARGANPPAEPVKDATAEADTTPKATTPAAPVGVTLEALRAKLQTLAASGKTDDARKAISSLGVAKLSELNADQYAACAALLDAIK